MLNFTIPKELYSHIGDYDVYKPKVVTTKAKAKTNTFPKGGIPENLIPESAVPKQNLLQAIDYLNSRGGHSTFYSNNAYTFCHNGTHVSIYLVAGRYWFATWFNPTDTDKVFSFSIAFRNLKSYKQLQNSRIWNYCGIPEEKFTSVIHNRKDYLYYHQDVTKENLEKREIVTDAIKIHPDVSVVFRNHLRKYILVWNIGGPFDAYSQPMSLILGNKTKDHSWKPDYFFIVEKIKSKSSPEFLKKLDTPFFRKKLNNVCQEFIDKYNSVNFDRWKDVLDVSFIYNLDWVDKLYDNQIPVDYLQTMWTELDYDNVDVRHKQRYSYPTRFSESTRLWIQQNVPYKSFVNMLIKDQRNIEDSVSMLQDVFRRNVNAELKYNGRWRPQEFHDWIMGENWKLTHKNEKLPQDLFPQPVKVDNMTFIQPINTHQLSQWGRAARNCVGSSSYSNGILKKNHFIILAMKNKEPYLTIQARLENEVLNITQIKKTCNASLTALEEKEYSNLFKKALMIRSMEVSND